MSAILQWSCMAVILSCCTFCISAQGCTSNRYTYYSNCDGYCHCEHIGACNSVNGVCTSGGCQARYTLQSNKTCQPVCGWNRHGDDCQGHCHCSVPSACNSYTGTCRSGGCETGYTVDTGGTYCQSFVIGCKDGEFGNPCKPCNCHNQEICDKTKGGCPHNGCSAGYRGTDCQQECLAGTFGVNCTGVCHCASQTECNSKTGACSGACAGGWTGINCQTPVIGCIDGAFGNPCKPCNCHNQEICDKTKGGCPHNGCSAGYRGTDCQQVCLAGTFGVNCAGACHCASQTECNIKTGACSGACVGGWTGINCQTPVSGCIDGAFGNPCKPCNCHNQEICDKTKGGCPHNGCSAGYRGTDCQQVCLAGTFGVNCAGACHCASQTECNIKTGACLGACAGEWTGINCQTPVIGCIDGAFGNPCKPCNCHNQEICDKTKGGCPHNGCSAGYRGTDCQQVCLAGTFGVNCAGACHCASQTECNIKTGACSGACVGGWTGINCQTPVSGCIDGAFGNPCKPCNCHNQEICDKTKGGCPHNGCSAGYRGTDCQQVCLAGTFGVNCAGACHCSSQTECNSKTGACSGACAGGWTGINCQTPVIGCIDGAFGNPCKPCNCHNQEICDKTRGGCPHNGCSAGYRGTVCQQVCLTWTFGVNCAGACHCASQTECNIKTGACSGACAGGWTGINCQTPVIGCIDGAFGNPCKPCNCHNQEICDKTRGGCPHNGCSAGYRGTDCQQVCLTGTFGVNCATTCHCASQADCNIKNGVCSGACAGGWTGINCQTPTSTGCPGGEFGNPCKPCNCDNQEICDKTKGGCPKNGCAAGYQGTDCQQAVPEASRASLAAPIGGGVAGLLVIVVVVVVIAIVIRRRRSPDLEGEDNSRMIVNAEHQNVANEGTSNAIYANGMETFSLSPIVIAIPHLLKYVENKLQHLDSIECEFKSIPGGLRGSTDIATRPENISKCRYKGILPYDHSRVVLEPRDSNPSDFINASYINGYVKPKEYIASQGPMNKVPGVTDFWNMAWQQNSDIIVMLTQLREAARYKCEQYWPSEGSQVYGYITVELLATHEFDDFCVRTLQAQAEGKVRTLKMFHFKEWGDHDVPRDTTGIILLREKIHSTKDETRGPIIVHCSAGVGRTGTFIAFDILMKRAELEGAVDIRQCISDIRNERGNMVQTKAQYKFLHKVLCDAWYCGGSTLTPVEFTETYETTLCSLGSSGKSRVQREFETLEKLKKERKNTDYSVAYESRNVTKNRDTAALPLDSERLFLATTVPERTDYINAVYLPGYMNKSAYISTQLPVSDTVVDFWRLVYEQHSTTIIMLNEADNLTKASGVYWPSDDEKIDVGPFEIRHQGNIQDGETFQRQFGLHYKKRAHDPLRTVRQLCVRSWPDGQNVPSSMNVLVDLFKSTQEWQRQHQNRPVIVHCMNGEDKTALVCTAWAILEKLKSEQVISVMLTVKQMRNKRPNAIRNLEQYRFCYELAKHYLEEFDTYANFQ